MWENNLDESAGGRQTGQMQTERQKRWGRLKELSPAYAGYSGLIHFQRYERIVCETDKLMAMFRESRDSEYDPVDEHGFSVSMAEVTDRILDWQSRDPFDESQWVWRA